MLIVLTNLNGQDISVNPDHIERLEPHSSKSTWTKVHFVSRAMETVQQTQAEIRALCEVRLEVTALDTVRNVGPSETKVAEHFAETLTETANQRRRKG